MTLVVTTASAQGITVVGDRAITRRSVTGVELLEGRKIWYSADANISLAFWGNANLPDGESLEAWARRFVVAIGSNDTVASVSDRLVSVLNPELESLGKTWSFLRRNPHRGYENGLPVIFHVHTGDPRAFHHALEVHRDYPDIHGGGSKRYRQFIETGGYAQIRNGYYELFATLARAAFDVRDELSSLLGVPVPAPTLVGQVAFDEALVRLASGILKSAQLPQSVSTDVDVIAFTPQGPASV